MNNANPAAKDRTGPQQKGACVPVSSDRPILDGRTDTRGLVTGSEREQLEAGFGSELRRARQASGLTIPRTAGLAGVGERHLRYLEAGQRRPSVDAIKALARVLAPESHREWLEQRLAGHAGESLREGNLRKKRRKENSQRREAVKDLAKHHRKVSRMIADSEREDRAVPEVLRRLATSPAVTDGIKGQEIKKELGIAGFESVCNAESEIELMRDPQAYMRERIAEIMRTNE